jgi:hypothetical protein
MWTYVSLSSFSVAITKYLRLNISFKKEVLEADV